VQPLRILVVATKSPWPPVDGGRLVLLTTIEALAAAGHSVELVAPCAVPLDETAATLARCCRPHLVAANARSAFGATVAGLIRGTPSTVARHSLPAVRRAVDTRLAEGGIDVVHAEQLHAVPQTTGAARLGLPVVHRAQNVEGILWAYASRSRWPPVRSILAFETRRMSIWESRVLETTAATVALTEPDRRALSDLVPGAVIHTVPAPFPAELPADAEPLDGNPAAVTLTNSSWAPSRDAAVDLAGRIWPRVRERLPDAVLHVFGGGHHLDGFAGVVVHPPPGDSRTAFPRGAIVIVPERHPTGVPMKALEAWARGLPLVADRSTAEALGADDGDGLLVARGRDGYAAALARLVDEDDLGRRLVARARAHLAEHHDPHTVAEHLTRIYRWAIDSGRS
jgi:glycosyltransferase involved in cell wall biosynthesis